MKMKKIIALVIFVIVVISAFTSCERGKLSKKGSSSLEEVNILYPGDESNRMSEFLDSDFAEVMEKELGIKLNVTFVSWDHYWTQKDIMLAAREPIDLFWDGLPSLSTIINKKQAQPLDELIKLYGQDMLKAIPMDHIKGGKVDGLIYGIPSAYTPSSAMYQSICLRQDLLEDVGMSVIKSPNDLMMFSTKVREKYPEIKGGAGPLIKPLTRYFTEEQYTWVASEDIVVFGEESHSVSSYYETDAFKKLAQFSMSMSDKGQYSDDVTLRYNERGSRLKSGLYLWVEGSLGKDKELLGPVRQNAPEARLKSYLLSEEKPKYINAAGGEVLCIPHSAPNPEGAMKFLNWIYKSIDNYNMAIYGIEGKDFNIVDGRIERINTNDFFYEWMFRNKNFKMFGKETDEEFINKYKHWDDEAIVSKSFGFAFDNTNVKEIENKLNEAIGTAFLPISTGFLSYEEYYPKALKKLKDAGIDEYVKEVQSQIEEFLEQS